MTDTKQRILDVALDLFIERGYDAVSLREIAEQVGVTKAALYYHFSSKDEIFRALAAPMQEITDLLVTGFAGPATPEAWAKSYEEVVDWILPRRRLLELLQNNRQMLQELRPDLEDEERHEALHERLDAALSDEGLSLDDRVRMAGSIGLLMSVLAFPSEAAFSRVSQEQLRASLLAAIRDLLRVG